MMRALLLACVAFAHLQLPVAQAARMTAAEKQAALDAHNLARCNVNPTAASMNAMVWDTSVEAIAQAWADTCPTAHNDGRSTGQPTYIGENLAWGYSNMVTATQAWVAEVSDYTLSSNTCASGGVCGHYTQVVWSASTKLGCAQPTTDTCARWGKAVYVCNYATGGNYNGQKPYVAGSGTNAACAGTTITGSSSTTTSTGAVRSGSTGSSMAMSSTGVEVITYPLFINGVRHVYTATQSIGNGITLYWKVTNGVLDLVCRRQNTGWLAFGFGSMMLDSHAVLGWKTSSNVSSVSVYALTERSTAGVQPLSASAAAAYVTTKEVDLNSTWTSLRITRPLAMSSKTISLTTATDMIFAYSSQVPTTTTEVPKHESTATGSVLFSGTGGVSGAAAGARVSVWSAMAALAAVAAAHLVF